MCVSLSLKKFSLKTGLFTCGCARFSWFTLCRSEDCKRLRIFAMSWLCYILFADFSRAISQSQCEANSQASSAQSPAPSQWDFSHPQNAVPLLSIFSDDLFATYLSLLFSYAQSLTASCSCQGPMSWTVNSTKSCNRSLAWVQLHRETALPAGSGPWLMRAALKALLCTSALQRFYRFRRMLFRFSCEFFAGMMPYCFFAFLLCSVLWPVRTSQSYSPFHFFPWFFSPTCRHTFFYRWLVHSQEFFPIKAPLRLLKLRSLWFCLNLLQLFASYRFRVQV